jgi:hypothetical protein
MYTFFFFFGGLPLSFLLESKLKNKFVHQTYITEPSKMSVRTEWAFNYIS